MIEVSGDNGLKQKLFFSIIGCRRIALEHFDGDFAVN